VITLLEQDISDVLEKGHSMLPNDIQLEEETVVQSAFTSNHVNANVQDSIGNFKETQDTLVENVRCLPNAPESKTMPQCQELPGKCFILVDETSPDPVT
jgi:hypothetical protein